MIQLMLTTKDNPYNPFTDYEEWYSWDFNSGYHTPSYLARVANVSEELSEITQQQYINKAVDEIVKENILGIYTKVSREVPDE